MQPTEPLFSNQFMFASFYSKGENRRAESRGEHHTEKSTICSFEFIQIQIRFLQRNVGQTIRCILKQKKSIIGIYIIKSILSVFK